MADAELTTGALAAKCAAVAEALSLPAASVNPMTDSAGMLSEAFLHIGEDGAPVRVIKTPPEEDFHREMFDRLQLQQREAAVYGLAKALRVGEGGPGQVLVVPKATLPTEETAGGCPAIIAIEHLGPASFKPCTLEEPLTVEQAELALQAIAHFHADLALLREATYESAAAARASLGGYPDAVWFAEMIYDSGVEDLRSRGASFLAGSTVETIAGAREQILAALVQDPDASSSFVTVGHCDCWSPNLLFAGDKVALIDFQFAKMEIPAVDVFYLLFSSMAAGERRQNWPRLLELYTRHLDERLRFLGAPQDVSVERIFGPEQRRRASMRCVLSIIAGGVEAFADKGSSELCERAREALVDLAEMFGAAPLA